MFGGHSYTFSWVVEKRKDPWLCLNTEQAVHRKTREFSHPVLDGITEHSFWLIAVLPSMAPQPNCSFNIWEKRKDSVLQRGPPISPPSAPHLVLDLSSTYEAKIHGTPCRHRDLAVHSWKTSASSCSRQTLPHVCLVSIHTPHLESKLEGIRWTSPPLGLN